MGDSHTIEIFGLFNLIFFIAFVCVFWNKPIGSILVAEIFILYILSVFVPIGIFLIIILIVMLVR